MKSSLKVLFVFIATIAFKLIALATGKQEFFLSDYSQKHEWPVYDCFRILV